MPEYRSIPVKLVDTETGEAFYIDPERGKLPWPDAPQSLQDALSRGAEPYWMQDIRIAQRAIEAERRAIWRSAPADSE